MSNVYLRMHNFIRMKELMDCLEQYNDLHIIGISSDGTLDFQCLQAKQVDVLVIEVDHCLHEFQQLLKNYEAFIRVHRMQILPLFQELSNEAIRLLLQYELSSFLVEPITSEMIVSALRKESRVQALEDKVCWSPDIFATNVLLELGLPMHLYGFAYIKSCAELLLEEADRLHTQMQEVYEACARKYETTSSSVEKCIRTAINYAYRRQPEKICIYNDKPTSSQIILFVSERLRLYHRR